MRIAIAILPLLATPALADAVTYRGTIGTRDAIIELTEPSDGAVAGRFAFLDTGKAIPLNPASHSGTTFVLSEEGRCTAEICSFDDEGNATSVPAEAHWELTLQGTALTGTRKGTGKTKSQEVTAEEIGRHPIDGDPTPLTLRDNIISAVLADDGPIDPAKAPFEMALADAPLVEQSTLTVGDAEVALMVDPRTRFAFPRIKSFVDGTRPEAVNAILANAHARLNLAALDCLPNGYIGFGANQYTFDSPETLGDYDSETVELSYASSTLVSWTEAGSIYCGGAHPYNHFNSYTYDVQTGQPLDLSRLFSGWVAREYGAEDSNRADIEAARANPDEFHWFPDDALIAFVRDNIPADYLSDDAEYETACYDDYSIREQLDIRFAPGPSAVFTVSGYPHVSSVCNGDLFTLPLSEMDGLLTPEATNYFKP